MAIKTTVDERGIIQEQSNAPDFQCLVGAAPNIYVNSLTELTSSVRDARLLNGARAYVDSREATFILQKSSNIAVTGSRVVTTKSGNGRWFRLPNASRRWLNQTTWHIDPTNGNDDNAGYDATIPIQTITELTERWGDGVLGQLTVVNISGTIPQSDPAFLRVHSTGSVNAAIFRGVRTTIGTGSVSNFTALNRTSNQFNVLESSTLSNTWSALNYVGKCIRITNGSRLGCWAWIVKDLGGANKLALTTPFVSQSSSTSTTLTQVTPTNTDTFEIVTFPTLSAVVRVPTFSVVGAFVFEDLTFGSAPAFRNFSSHFITRCDTAAGVGFTAQKADLFILASHMTGTISASPGSGLTIQASLCEGAIIGGFGSTIRLQDDSVHYKGAMSSNEGMFYINNVGWLDSTANAVNINTLGNMQIFGTMYGSGTAGVGIQLSSNARVTYAALPNMITTGSNVVFGSGGTARTWAQLPWADYPLGAGAFTGSLSSFLISV